MKRSYSAVENTYNCFSWRFSDGSNCSHFFISLLSCVQIGEFVQRALHGTTIEQLLQWNSFSTFLSSCWAFSSGRITSKLLILERVMKFNHKNRTHTHAAALIMMLLSRLALPTKLISFLWFFLLDFFCFEYEPKFLLHFLYSAIFFGYSSYLPALATGWRPLSEFLEVDIEHKRIVIPSPLSQF